MAFFGGYDNNSEDEEPSGFDDYDYDWDHDSEQEGWQSIVQFAHVILLLFMLQILNEEQGSGKTVQEHLSSQKYLAVLFTELSKNL